MNQRCDGVSPAVASMYCSPHPAALHIAPAARLRGCCLYDFAPGELLCEDDGDLRFLARVTLHVATRTTAKSRHENLWRKVHFQHPQAANSMSKEKYCLLSQPEPF
jgi:hypothetical protein